MPVCVSHHNRKSKVLDSLLENSSFVLAIWTRSDGIGMLEKHRRMFEVWLGWCMEVHEEGCEMHACKCTWGALAVVAARAAAALSCVRKT